MLRVTTKGPHPSFLYIDNERITFAVRRMTRDEAYEFDRMFTHYGTYRGDLETFNKLPPDEQKKRDDETQAFIRDTVIENIVSIDAGQMEHEREIDDVDNPGKKKTVVTPITNGAELIAAYPLRMDVWQGFYQSVYVENFLGVEAKKKSREQRIFWPGSALRRLDQAGNELVPTATRADETDSVHGAGVTASPSQVRAGAPSSSSAAIASRS